MRFTRTSRHGFTLTELLVALTVIAILIALLVPVVGAAIRRARAGQTVAEIDRIAQALESYKAKFGAYPPSHAWLREDGFQGEGPLAQRTMQDLRRIAGRARFSIYAPTVGPVAQRGLPASQQTWYDYNGNGQFDAAGYELQGQQCLVFFLGGVPGPDGKTPSGFSVHPLNPFTGDPLRYPSGSSMHVMAGADRSMPMYEFRNNRLVVPAGNTSGVPGYLDPLGADTEGRFYAYFRSNGGDYFPDDCDSAEQAPDGPAPNPIASGPTSWANRMSYQLFSAGQDRLFGPGGQQRSEAEADNIGNVPHNVD